jgi:hypothetical protein
MTKLERLACEAKGLSVSVMTLALIAMVSIVPAGAQDLDPVENSLDPYNGNLDAYKGVPHDITIDQSNVDQYSEYLDETLADLIGQGMYDLKVGETYSFRPHDIYVQSTREHAGKASLGDEPGVLLNYIAGRPFIEEPSLDDPRAGEKLAWNSRYAYSGDGGVAPRAIWDYRDMRKGKVERTIETETSVLKFKHRIDKETGPDLDDNPAQIYQALYLNVIEPPDIADTQLLIHRPEDDRKRDTSWMYVPSQRRVRLVGSKQTTDSFLGSDVMIEDFLGYNGRLMDMKWTYKGTTKTLLAYYKHDEMPLDDRYRNKDGFKYAGLTGQAGCFPDVSWQLRKAYVLEAEPYDEQHPISKRVFYVDAQTHTASLINIYDRAGRLWKIGMAGFSHPDHHHADNKGSGANVFDIAIMIDIQAQHCTTIQFKAMLRNKVKRRLFDMQNMRSRGR